LRNQPAGAGGEFQLADAIKIQTAQITVEVVSLNGRRFDYGNIHGYVEVIKYMS
jgi:UTP--glucose-1-phosphate uridylyltransferase